VISFDAPSNFGSNFASIFDDNSVKRVYFISLVLTCLLDENGPLVALSSPSPPLFRDVGFTNFNPPPKPTRQPPSTGPVAVARNAFVGHRVAGERFRSVVLPPAWCLLPQKANLHPTVSLVNFKGDPTHGATLAD
jgi:hypothetical protein